METYSAEMLMAASPVSKTPSVKLVTFSGTLNDVDSSRISATEKYK